MAKIDDRMVAAEIKTNVAAIKTTVDALKVSVDAINTVAAAWTVDGADSALPAASAIKTQLEAYDLLNVGVSKPANSISDSLAVIRAAV